MTALAPEIKRKIIREVDLFLTSKELDTLNERELEFITKSLLTDKLKEELKIEIKKYKTDIGKLKKKWLSCYKSEATRRSYGDNLDIFLSWLNSRDKRKSIITLKAVDLDDYLSSLKNEKISDNTLRLRIAAVSSFLSYLVRIEVLDRNYCKGLKGLPEKRLEVKSADDIPGEEEIRKMEMALYRDLSITSGSGYKGKVKAGKMGLLVLALIKDTALRVGALPNLEIDKRGRYRALSKGRTVTGKVSPEVLTLIEDLGFDCKRPFDGYRTETIKIWFARFGKRLVRDGILNRSYNLHSVRHFAAINFWNESKDIYRLKNFLSHKSIVNSQIYLSSLNIDI